MIAPAPRIASVEEYYFSKKLKEIEKLNSAGKEVINLGIGSPDLKPHESVIAALNNSALTNNAHGYQSYRGTAKLREAYKNWYNDYFSVSLDPDKEILPLLGSKEGIMHISMSYLSPGDEVLIPNPGYPAYSATAKLAGATVQYYALSDEHNWQPDLIALSKKDLSKVKIMWVNYPHMPTGAVAEKDLFQRLSAFGKTHNILICNDNPYSFILNDKPTSILSSGLSDYVLELNSLSKSHNMAGWRVGMIAATQTHIDNLIKFKSNMDSGMFKPVQEAAVEALNLDSNWFNQINTVYSARKKVALAILKTLKCVFDENQAGLFVWGRIPKQIPSVEKFTDSILYEAAVFLVPGTVFGSRGERYIRISLCADISLLKKALSRVKSNQP